MKYKLAGFIITYERHEILTDTLSKIFNQTYPPEKIIVVDNSESTNTQELIIALNNPSIEYFRVGYNAGPAGGAYLGLKKLAEQGYDWIYWGDDDDPPDLMNIFEILIKIGESSTKCGCLGKLGHNFDKLKGEVKRTPDEELYKKGILKVDNIGGNMVKIINGSMVRDYSIYPDPELFFGFEELDFDLRIKSIGYNLYVDRELFLEHRTKHNMLGFKRERKTNNLSWRNYYSTRNLIIILKKNNYYLALIIIVFKTFLKMILGFKKGYRVGWFEFKNQGLALLHGLFSVKGLKVLPVKKEF